MGTDILKKHASCLKGFLMTPWMKRSEWATVKTATEDLAESIERYAFELSGKKVAVARRNDTQIDCASDDIAFSALNVIVQYTVFLGPLPY